MTKMPLRTWTTCLVWYIKTMRKIKFRYFVLLSCSSLLLPLLLIQRVTRHDAINKNLAQDLIEHVWHIVKQIFRFLNTFHNTKHLPKNLKYMLLWTSRDFTPFSFLEEGQRSFLKENCSVVNCYITDDQMLFGEDYTKFNAIAFNGRNQSYYLPRYRSHHQKYIFFNMESADYYPVCEKQLDGFFNMTATYKLDSDLPLPYFLIRDKNRAIVGPKRRMQWRENMDNREYNYYETIRNKTKMAAWFVSNCRAISNRDIFVEKLQKALSRYGHKVDVFGSCGKLSCPRSKTDACNLQLKNNYFFYLALENSFAEDYVTEKILTALKYSVVPIVYGAADYSRFLPPHSYIDGRKMHVYKLAALMYRLARSPKQYSRYFNWKSHYTYHYPIIRETVCSICEALNDRSLMEKTTIYENFRSWWTPNFLKRCNE